MIVCVDSSQLIHHDHYSSIRQAFLSLTPVPDENLPEQGKIDGPEIYNLFRSILSAALFY